MKMSLSPFTTANLWGGLLGGTIDVFTAALIYLTSPVLILYAIANSLLGKPAFGGVAGPGPAVGPVAAHRRHLRIRCVTAQS